MSQHHRTGGWTSKDARTWRPRIAATLPRPCVDCGQPVTSEMKWQIGHIVPLHEALAMGWSKSQINQASNLGPSHAKAPGQRACNQIEGGKMGAAKTTAKKITVETSRREW